MLARRNVDAIFRAIILTQLAQHTILIEDRGDELCLFVDTNDVDRTRADADAAICT